jgi:hypothetical protein
MDDEADITITLPRTSALSAPTPNPNLNRDSIISSYVALRASLSTRLWIQFCGMIKRGNVFQVVQCNGSSFGQHLTKKQPSSREVPRVKLEESNSTNTPMAFSCALPGNHNERSKEHAHVGQERLIDLTVWNGAPITPKTGELNWSN